jgi:predicted secreted protein with PEFG-CTERM motif
LSNIRTCVRETISYENVTQLRDLAVVDVRDDIIKNIRSIDPQCRADTNRLIAGLEADVTQQRWDEAVLKIQNVTDLLDSEECISDPKERQEVINQLNTKLNVILRAVPEFETMAIIILSISIITVIGITRRSKLNLSLMRQ